VTGSNRSRRIVLRSHTTSATLRQRPNGRSARIVALDSGVGLANATLQQRLVAVRLFYDHLIEEGKRETNPSGEGGSRLGTSPAMASAVSSRGW